MFRTSLFAAVGVSLALLTSAASARAQSTSDPLASGPVSLENILERVRSVNPDLEVARERYAAALRNETIAGALEDPMLEFAWSPLPTETRAGPLEYRIGLSQRLPFWGKRALRSEVAAGQAAAQGALVEVAEFDLQTEATLTFHEWRFARRAIEINGTTRELLEQFRQIAEQRYRAGLVPQSDALKARVALARIEVQEARYERMKRVTTGRLNALLNRAPDAPLGNPAEPMEVVPGFDYAQLLKVAANARAELKAISKRIDAAESSVALRKREYFPDFNLGVSYAPVEGGTNPMFPDDGDDVVTAMIGMSIPLQVPRRNAALTQARLERDAARSEERAVLLRVQFEVHRAHAAWEEARQIVALYRERIVPVARAELEATRRAYENAQVQFLSLLDSERAYEQFLLEQAAAVRELGEARARLERAVGLSLVDLPALSEAEWKGKDR